MSDYKAAYSDISNEYITTTVPQNDIDKERYDRSKDRESRNNENWNKQKVNLNDIVYKFIPTKGEVIKTKTEGGVKYVFEGDRYKIKCDKVAGYLRIYDKEKKGFCKLDGTISRNNSETHFKIKRREEM